MFPFIENLFTPPRHLLLLFIAGWVGLTLAEKRAHQHGINKNDLGDIASYSFMAFIIGGRISFVLQNLSAFSKSPLNFFSINLDLFDPIGGAIAFLITLVIYAQKKNLSVWSMLDALTLFFASIPIGIALSHLAAGTAFGTASDVAWSIELWNANRHPNQIYNLIASSLTFSLFWFQKQNLPSGIPFLIFVSLTSISVLFTSAFQANQPLIFNGLIQSQVIALTILISSFVLLEIRLKGFWDDESL